MGRRTKMMSKLPHDGDECGRAAPQHSEGLSEASDLFALVARRRQRKERKAFASWEKFGTNCMAFVMVIE